MVAVGAGGGLARLARGRRRQVVVRVDAVAVVNLAQRRAARGRGPIGRRRGGMGAGARRRLLHGADGGAGDAVAVAVRGGHLAAETGLDALLDAPLAEGALVDVQPVLLRADDHAGTHEAHEGDGLVGGEGVAVDEVGADEAAGAAEPGLAVHGDGLLAADDGLVGEADELAHRLERRAGAVLEDHVEVLDAERLEVRRRVQVRVEAHDEPDVAVGEVAQHVAERPRQRRVGVDLGGVARQGVVQRRRLGHALDGLVLRRREGEEVRRDPVEVAVLDALEALVLVEVEVLQVDHLLLLGLPHAVHHVLHGDAVVGLAVAGVSEGHQRRVDLGDGGEGEVRWPALDENHIAGHEGGGICPAWRLLVRWFS